MTYCKYCHKPVRELGKDICLVCERKQRITKGWHFTYQSKRGSRKCRSKQ